MSVLLYCPFLVVFWVSAAASRHGQSVTDSNYVRALMDHRGFGLNTFKNDKTDFSIFWRSKILLNFNLKKSFKERRLTKELPNLHQEHKLWKYLWWSRSIQFHYFLRSDNKHSFISFMHESSWFSVEWRPRPPNSGMFAFGFMMTVFLKLS